jgi:hypothetical protein
MLLVAQRPGNVVEAVDLAVACPQLLQLRETLDAVELVDGVG